MVWGWGVGAFAGFVMPEILHYRHRDQGQVTADDVRAKARSAAAPRAVDASFVPRISMSGIELGVAGTF